MRLDAYLSRIGFEGRVNTDLATLTALHAAHVRSVPFENLDVQLGVPLGTDVATAYEKIVTRRRGGWCYEQNGLFGWALAEAGFAVLRVAGAVMRQLRGDASAASHLCLLVRLADRTFLCDVGFGGSLLEPIELAEGGCRPIPFEVRLRRLGDRYWRFEEQGRGEPFSFDFRAEPADEGALARKCRWLQSDPASPFVQNVVVQRRLADTHVSLRGRVLTTATGAGLSSRVLDSAPEYAAVLAEAFGLDVPHAASLWPAIVARHETLLLNESVPPPRFAR